MEKSFTFDSSSFENSADICEVIEVTLDIKCRDSDGVDASYEISYLYNVTRDCEVTLDQLVPSERLEIENDAQKLADENGSEAYQSYMEGRAEQYADWHRDGSAD